MRTNAGVFGKIAAGAVREVECELFDARFGIWAGLDLNDSWEVVALGHALLGEESGVVFQECHLHWRGAFAGRDGDDLLGGSYGFLVIIDKGDLNFAIRCDKEFRVRFDGGQNASTVRAGDFFFVAALLMGLQCEGAQDGDGGGDG